MNKSSYFLFLVCLLLLSGCSGPRLKVALSTTANLNLNEFEEPLPVVVRIYQLSDEAAFLKADFQTLWKRDLTALGDSLLTRDEIVLNPAHQDRLVYPRHDKAGFVGVMAVFRRPGEEGWRDIRPIADSFLSRRFSNSVVVSLKGNTVDIQD